MLLVSAICVKELYNNSTCSPLFSTLLEIKRWSWKSTSLSGKKLQKFQTTVNWIKLNIVTKLVEFFLSVHNQRQKEEKTRWSLILSSLVHNLMIMFSKRCWDNWIREFFFSYRVQDWWFLTMYCISKKRLLFISSQVYVCKLHP